MYSPLGKNWILLRGLARESAHWGAFVSQLQAAFPDATITLLDLPGTGRFYLEASPSNIPDIVEQVRNQALAQGLLKQPVTLLALSLGGMVAWEWLRRYPEDIAAASLMNTSFSNLSPFYQRLRWQIYQDFIALLMTRKVYQREVQILQLTSNLQFQDDDIPSLWHSIQQERPMSLSNSFRQIIAAARYKPCALKPTPPVLLLNGGGDRLVSPACSDAIQQQYQLELRRHPWAGHDLTLDDGAWVIAQLQDWQVNLDRDRVCG